MATVGSNLSFRKPKRSLVVSGIYGAYDQRCSDLAMTEAAEWRMEKCGKMPLRDTFRVGQIISADCITLTANNDTCLLAMNECAAG